MHQAHHCQRRIRPEPFFRVVSATIAAALAFVLTPVGGAQTCSPRWLPGAGVPGTSGPVQCMTMWDPDGAGPGHPLLVMGGVFGVIHDKQAQNIATFDPDSREFAPFGTGANSNVRALAVLQTGELVAAGNFSSIDGVAASFIAKFDGNSWAPLGGGTNGAVHALAVLPDGSLIAGGDFTRADGVIVNRIAKWNGAAWAPMQNGVNSNVRALVTMPNGDLIAGGFFTTAGGAPANSVARWNGSAWSALGSGLNANVNALALTPGGDLYAGGGFGGGRVARWDGVSWNSLAGGVSADDPSDSVVYALHPSADGGIIVGGEFTIAGAIRTLAIAKWDGAAWSALGGGAGGDDQHFVSAIASLPSGEIIAGGNFHNAENKAAEYIASWDGESWSAIGRGFDSNIYCLTRLPSGDVVAGGDFRSAGAVRAQSIARWNGADWSELAPKGLVGPLSSCSIYASIVMPNGDLVVGGSFYSIDGVPADFVARWDGESWHALGSGVSGGLLANVRCLSLLPNGDLIVGGAFNGAGGSPATNIARWDGSNWWPLGSGIDGAVYALATLSNGDVIAGGQFANAGGGPAANIARWDGSGWNQLGAGTSGLVRDVKVLPNGDVIAGGNFLNAGGGSVNRIARWNGANWSSLGTGVAGGNVLAIMLTPGGDVIAGGLFSTAGGNAARCVARWNGTTWSSFDTGIIGGVYELLTLDHDEFAAAGFFYTAGSQISAHFARWSGTNTPWIVSQPGAQSVCQGGTMAFTATPATGYVGLGAAWELETAASSGVYAALGNGVIPGAGAATATISELAPTAAPGSTTLTVTNAAAAMSGRRIRATISNACASATTVAVAPAVLPDLTGGGAVNTADLALFLGLFGQTVTPGVGADFNGDGSVNTADLVMLLAVFGSTCP